MYYSLEGPWSAKLKDGTSSDMILPGSLDENKIGYRDTGANQWHPDASIGNADDDFRFDAPISTRFTRKYTYEGEVCLTRRIYFEPPKGKRVFLEAERSRCLKLLVDGKEIPDFTPASISTPHVFEITGLLDGENELTILSDNSYPGLPHDEIVYSSAATDETQTNWNGVLGYLRLRLEEPVFISAIYVYPKKKTVTVVVEISADMPYTGELTIKSEAISETMTVPVCVPAGISEICLESIPLKDDVKSWDENEGNLYELAAGITDLEEKTVNFGVRDFGYNEMGRLTLNDRVIFLRSESNCGVFPETGYPPMTVEEWVVILTTYKSYGINCMRFHSYCPPEAAFTAADQIGMLMQPELSHWNPKNAFESEESFSYYQIELKQIIRMLANHPSFVMLTFGNELWTGELGHSRMSQLLDEARKIDCTRLYANGSNVHYGKIGCDGHSDFYTSQTYFKDPLRGTFAGHLEHQDDIRDLEEKKARIKGYINNCYPNSKRNYDKTMNVLRKEYKKPVFSFEVGQFEILPDFSELEDFQGISDPVNYRLIQEKVEQLGLKEVWNQYVEASGEIARIGYREEIEAAMRTKELSGISLLGLQDFPGQGTALVGMLNAHLKPKPFDFAKPEAFQAFFRDQLPLVELEKYTYESGEILTADVVVANFGKEDICGDLKYELKNKGFSFGGNLSKIYCPMGELTTVGKLEIPLSDVKKAARMELTATIGEIGNCYPIWIYPKDMPVCPEGIYETKILDDKAKSILEMGGTVYLSPDSTKEHLPSSIQAQFTTDFWSVGTFTHQEGGMGQLIDAKHPVFEEFPTENHTNWQWWPMATQRAIILPEPLKAIITEMDSYAYMRPMAKLLEGNCGGGKILISSMGLQNLQQYPEARALLSSIYKYITSNMFIPQQNLTLELIESLVK